MVEQKEALTEATIDEIAQSAAGIVGQDWATLPGGSQDRWRTEVRAAQQGGQDDTTVGQAVRKAIQLSKEKPVPKVVAKVEAPKIVAKK